MAKMRTANVQLLDILRADMRAADVPARALYTLDGLRHAHANRNAEWYNEAENFMQVR